MKLFVLLSIALFCMSIGFTSCKKEFSCENCRQDNKPPNAVAVPDQVITLPTDSISLDGSSSSDPDGMISEWLWMKISGPASFTVTIFSTAKTGIEKLIAGCTGISKRSFIQPGMEAGILKFIVKRKNKNFFSIYNFRI